MPSSSRPEPRFRRRAAALPEIPFRADAAAAELLLDELLEAVACVALNGRFVGGEEVDLLEQRLAWLLGQRVAHAVRGGEEAVRLALGALGVGPGARVALPAAAPVPLARAVAAVGAEPLWMPVDPLTGCVTPAAIAEAIAVRPACLVLVHLFGATLDARGAAVAAAAAGVPVLEDVSHAVGARHGRRGVGAAGAVTVVGLGPDDLLGGWGDAGAVLTSEPERAEHVLERRTGPLDTVPAAVLRRRLVHLEREAAARGSVAATLRDGLAGSAAVPLALPAPESGHAVHRFVVRCGARDELRRHLERRGVATEVPPLAGPSPLAGEALALPAWGSMTPAQVRRVVLAARAFGGQGERSVVCELPTRP